MNTLHFCHWQNPDHFNLHLKFIDTNRDSLVIFGELDDSALTEVERQLSTLPIKWYLVNDEKQPYIKEHTIDHHQWLKLITSHHNCFAWK